jgi:hypothetical protein
MSAPSNGNQLDIAVAAALHVLDVGDARAVQVMTGTRPTYQQLKVARETCDERGYAFTARGTNGFVVRRSPAASCPTAFSHPAERRRGRPGWFDHLADMREGVQ